MKTVSASDITQEQFDSAVQVVIAGIKSSDPNLDTRPGTVLRELLANPEAQLEAIVSAQLEEARKASSLKLLKESEDSGDSIDESDVNSVLSNFNMSSMSGTNAQGLVRVTVSNTSVTYTITSGTNFKTATGLLFSSTSKVTASVSDGTMKTGAAGGFFTVPVKCSSVGASGNIQQGTVLIPQGAIYSFVSAEAYRPFDGGSDAGDLASTISRIPAGLSIRGFVNKNACEGMLRDTFDSGDWPIVAVSSVGYGNSCQRRDRHNPFGVGVGGRIDLYVRNFGDPYTVTKNVTGTLVSDGEYLLSVTPSDFPGSCWIKSVTDASSSSLSSLTFTASRSYSGTGSTWHDLDMREHPEEAFNTVWQGFSVMVSEVPSDGSDSSSSGGWSSSRDFSVTTYCLPQCSDLQAYADRDDIRNVGADVVVRCPVICWTTVSATARYRTEAPVDADDAKYKIRKYINSLGFVGRLTRSEIVHILKGCGATSVDLSRKDMLYGTLRDAFGKEILLQGDALDVSSCESGKAMVSKDTVVFVSEPDGIQLRLVPEE